MKDQKEIDKVLKEIENKLKRTRYGNIKVVVSESSNFVDVVTEERTRIFKDDVATKTDGLRRG